MWVYWLTLGVITAILYFPVKILFSSNTAKATSIATFCLGLLYPFLQSKLTGGQISITFGLVLVSLGIVISKEKNYKKKPAERACVEASDGQDNVVTEVPGINLTETEELDDPGKASEPCPPLLIDSPEQTAVNQDITAETMLSEDTLELEPSLEPSKEIACEAEMVSTQPITSVEILPALEVPPEEAFESETCEEIYKSVESTVEKISEPEIEIEETFEHEPLEVVSPEASLLAEGLRLSRQRDYTGAVRSLNQVVKAGPEPELLYVAVSELSSVYQHLGLYTMASQLIAAFANHPDLKSHPGLENLKQKMKYISSLENLLQNRQLGHIPYDQVPNNVRREAYANSLI